MYYCNEGDCGLRQLANGWQKNIDSTPYGVCCISCENKETCKDRCNTAIYDSPSKCSQIITLEEVEKEILTKNIKENILNAINKITDEADRIDDKKVCDIIYSTTYLMKDIINNLL